jgi:hypothetical protein
MPDQPTPAPWTVEQVRKVADQLRRYVGGDVRGNAAAMLDHLADLLAASAWRPISEAPKDQRAVLACHTDNRTGQAGMKVCYRVRPDADDYTFPALGPDATWKPNRWMLLPALPVPDARAAKE